MISNEWLLLPFAFKTIQHRVGHLILRALAIRASNRQNALARISFHSPIFWTIWSIKLCHTDMDYGKFVFRDFSAKQNIKNIVYFAI